MKDKNSQRLKPNPEFIALKEAAKPLLKLLNDKYNPHTVAIVTPTSVELLDGKMSIPKIMDFMKD